MSSASGITKIANTKKALLDAFYKLSKTERIEDITVSALCKEAKVNRTTFYKYYSVPSDVLIEKAQDVASLSSTFSMSNDVSLYDKMLELCRLFYNNREFVNLYFTACGSIMPLICKAIIAIETDVNFMKKPVNNFLSGGVTGLAIYWLQHNYEESPEEIARLLTEYIGKFMD